MTDSEQAYVDALVKENERLKAELAKKLKNDICKIRRLDRIERGIFDKDKEENAKNALLNAKSDIGFKIVELDDITERTLIDIMYEYNIKYKNVLMINTIYNRFYKSNEKS